MKRIARIALVASCSGSMAFAGAADARPGGGSSFSSSRSSTTRSSSGSTHTSSGTSHFSFGSSNTHSGSSTTYSGSDYHPSYASSGTVSGSAIGALPIALGLLSLVVVAGCVALALHRQTSYSDWGSSSSGTAYFDPPAAPPPPPRQRGARRELERLKKSDPNFSVVLFEDFLYALYVEVARARGGTLDRLSAYVVEPVRRSLPPAQEVRDVIIGAMTLVEATGVERSLRAHVKVEFEVNYTEVKLVPEAFYAREEWVLARKPGATSRTPEKVFVFACPSCGASLDLVVGGKCNHCSEVVGTGDFDWVVERITVTEKSPRGPILTGMSEETGTNLPTVVDPRSKQRLDRLMARDPSFSWAGFEARVKTVFDTFQGAWAARDLAPMRPLLSDRLFATQTYWAQAYTKQRLRNVTEGARITAIEAARCTRDRFFDAITVRVFATSKDYTVSDDGTLMAGSRTKDRAYSEYWTFIRGHSSATERTVEDEEGVTPGDAPPAPVEATRAERVKNKQCPTCGAGLAINMAGACAYCGSKVWASDFDWVLSRIEQDEAYEG